MTRLIPCTSCQSHVMQSDASCPHCGAKLRSKSGPRPGWVLFGLAMAGCPAEDVYGCPDPCGPDPDTASTGETTQGETENGTTTDGTDTGTDGTDTGTDTGGTG